MKKPNDKAITAAKIVAGVAAALALGCNMTGCVYGPPPTSSDASDATKKQTTTASETEESIDPSDNQNEDVYGPPEFFETDKNEVPAVYGPPEDFTSDESAAGSETSRAGDNG